MDVPNQMVTTIKENQGTPADKMGTNYVDILENNKEPSYVDYRSKDTDLYENNMDHQELIYNVGETEEVSKKVKDIAEVQIELL